MLVAEIDGSLAASLGAASGIGDSLD
jgi:hypothetical protein